MEKKANLYGLLGKKLSHSFSKTYFNEYFENQNLHSEYINFEIDSIDQFPQLIDNHPKLKGFNVTIPFKQSIIPFLTELSDEIKSIGAVNCVLLENGKTIGYNTDYIGFSESFQKLKIPKSVKVLILGNGGASKAIQYALKQLGYAFEIATTGQLFENCISYDHLNENNISEYDVIINCTPLGMYPDEKCYPEIPYSGIQAEMICYDVVYSKQRDLTGFLNQCKPYSSHLHDGFEMLINQAEACKKIWKI